MNLSYTQGIVSLGVTTTVLVNAIQATGSLEKEAEPIVTELSILSNVL
jgi:hypothetical protein